MTQTGSLGWEVCGHGWSVGVAGRESQPVISVSEPGIKFNSCFFMASILTYLSLLFLVVI